MKPHKWAKEIKAWADGAEIEFRVVNNKVGISTEWFGATTPEWNNDDLLFRIKPKPKEPQYLYLFVSNNHVLHARNERHGFYHLGEYMGKIKLEVDDE